MRFGRFEIVDRFEVEGGGADALAQADGKDLRLWIGCPGSGGPGALESLEALRKKLSTLYHASLPSVLGGEVVEERAVLVLQPYHGRRLSEVLTEHAPETSAAIDIVRSAGAALVKAHRAGVVHGAITPDEIFRTQDGRTLLLHLGWGPFLGPRGPRAPDAAAGTDGAEAGDVFALARVLVQCLEGRDPFPSLSSGPARDAESFAPELPQGLRRLLARALHPDPSRRMRRAEELAGDLGVLRASWDSLSKAPPRPSIPFPPILQHGRLVAVALALALAALLVFRACGGEKPG